MLINGGQQRKRQSVMREMAGICVLADEEKTEKKKEIDVKEKKKNNGFLNLKLEMKEFGKLGLVNRFCKVVEASGFGGWVSFDDEWN